MAATNTILGSVNLQSKDHEELLNTIDGLRSLGISRYVDLPQIIVCGDQSSGKSSVLEAISGVQFPVKDTLCTRVATELILRRSPVIGGSISIVPSSDRVEEEMTRLQQWKATECSLGDLPAVLEEAMVAMDIDGSLKNFGRDVLRVEVSGPDQPHLTLVDLPGLFHAGTKEQSELEADMVKELVISYMKNPRSIVLAVISASNDINNQIVLSHTQKIDPKGMRTLGIITKPDCLPVGSASEEKYYKLAGNQDVVFQLGWHVLKNRDYAHRHSSAKARDKAEEEFFSQGLWTSMSKAKLGVASLKPRLSAVLREQILTHLPSLIADVRVGIAESRAALGKLGDSRVSTREQRSYLLHLSERFTSIMKDAVNGRYEDPFFAVADTQSKFARRLRARVQNFLTDFRDEVRLGGCYKPAGDEASYIDHVRQLMLYNRGRELSGTFNPQIIGELFHEQSKPWKEIAIQFAELLFSAVAQAVTILLKYLTDETTFSKLMRHLINPAINDIKGKLDQMLRTILARFQYGHPITYNHYLIENVQKARERRLAKQLESKIKHYFHRETINNKITIEARTEINVNEMASKLARTSEVDMEKFAAMEAIDMTDAYYKVSETFVSDSPYSHPNLSLSIRSRGASVS